MSFLVQTKQAFDNLLQKLSDSPIFSYDTETNGTFDRFKVQMVGVSFAWRDDGHITSCYVPLSHLSIENQVPIGYALDGLKSLLETKDQETVCHNTKFDEMVMSRHDINVATKAHDTFVMAWLLSESGPKGLKALSQQVFNAQMDTFEDTVNAAPKKKNVPRDHNFARVEADAALKYAAADAYWCLKLFEHFKTELENQQLWDAYYHVERPFVRILRNIEDRGVYIDLEAIERADKRLPRIAEEVEASIYEQAGEVFNIGSGDQLGRILFEKLGIGNNVRKTPTGKYSTDKKVLAKYATRHKIVEDILRRKKVVKTHSTFVEGLKKNLGEDGRVHTSFNGCGTVTGRLSSNKPNLQNIEGDEVEEVKVRTFYIPTPGFQQIVGDFSQVELRLIAHFARDEEMIKAFLSGRDFHEETARRMYNLCPDEPVAARQRFHAKAINFGIGYGRGAGSIAEQLSCTQEEAESYIEAWKEAFPKVFEHKNFIIKQARERGYVRTLTGRKRRLLPEIRSNIGYVRGHAERQAYNTVIQGSAADLIKMAMIALEPQLHALGGYINIQIHDELVCEIPDGKADETLQTMKETMEHPHKGTNPLRLPLIVDLKTTKNWSEGK